MYEESLTMPFIVRLPDHVTADTRTYSWSRRFMLICFYVLDERELIDLEIDPVELESVFETSVADAQAELVAELARVRTVLKVPEDTRPVGECNSDAKGWNGFAAD